jgi:hypothetical protein
MAGVVNFFHEQAKETLGRNGTLIYLRETDELTEEEPEHVETEPYIRECADVAENSDVDQAS